MPPSDGKPPGLVWEDQTPEAQSSGGQKPPGLVWQDQADPNPNPASREPADGIVLSSDRPVWDRIKGFARDTAEAFKGQSEFDLPEIATVYGNRTMLGGAANVAEGPYKQYPLEDRARMETVVSGLALARDAQGQMNIIKEQFPGARFSADKFGNPIVRIGNERFYINRSGFSGQDMRGLVAEGAILASAMHPAAKGGQVLAGGVGRLGGAGLGAAGGSVVQDVAAAGAGSGQPVDLQRAGVTGLLGMGFEGGMMLLQRVPSLRTVFGSPALYRQGSGLTQRGRAILQENGISPDDISPAMAERLSRIARETDDIAAAARKAEAQTLPSPVALTGAQSSRNPALMAAESEAKKGALGQEAQSLLLETQAQQQAALRGNIPAIQNRLSGGQRQVMQPGEGTAAAQEALVAQRAGAQRGVRQAYQAAETASATNPAWFDANAVRQLGQSMRQAVKSYDPAQFPNMTRRLQELENLGLSPGANVKSVNFNGLEGWRRRAVASERGAASKQEAAGIRSMIRLYDEAIEGRLKDALIAGDDATIALARKATSLRARFGKVFEQDDIVNELTAQMRDGSRRLAVGSDDAVNYIFGRSRLGAKKGLQRDLVKLRDTLGPDSAEWNAIREDAFLRLFRNQPAIEAGAPFNAQAFSKELVLAEAEAPAAMKILFSSEERALMHVFKRAAINMNTTPAIAANANPSGTAYAGRIADAFGPLGRLAQSYVRMVLNSKVGRAPGLNQLNRSVSGDIPSLPPTGGVGGPAAVPTAILNER